MSRYNITHVTSRLWQRNLQALTIIFDTKLSETNVAKHMEKNFLIEDEYQ